jgi:anti-anti-sigma regulatory factor
MLKITRVIEAGSTRVTVSGRIGAPQLPDLRQFLEAENASNVVLDLSEVSLVDEEVVQFLLRCEAQGIGLVGLNRTGFIGGLIPREDGPHGTPQ